ncbi:TPA: hypothetical protein ACPY9J_002264 [Yersinia enterocolitica]
MATQPNINNNFPPPPTSKIECGDEQRWVVENKIQITAGARCTLSTGDYCHLTAGAESVVSCHNYSTVKVTNNCTVTAGKYCVIRGGLDCEITAGPGSTLSAEEGSELKFYWWMGDREQVTRLMVGEDGIKANIPYQIQAGRVVAVN